MKSVISIGAQDFTYIRKNHCFYVDKTSFIKEWWKNQDAVTLTYQGSPPLLSRKDESGGLGDLLVSGGVQAPSDKLRQQHREMRK